MKKQDWEFLKKLLSTPTAPFREEQVIKMLSEELDRCGLPYCIDSVGNMLLGVSSLKEWKQVLATKGRQSLCLMMAHMDHPGFHIREIKQSGRAKFDWHGGGPLKGLRGAEVYVANKKGEIAFGKITSAKLAPSKKWVERGSLALDDFPVDFIGDKDLFGGISFPNFVWRRGKRVYTKAADDLAGVYSIVTSFKRAWKKTHSGAKVVGLLTVGEEVGWVGAIDHFKKYFAKKPKRDVYVVSLEASRTLPKAEMGKGPVVRWGDKSTIFHPRLTDRLMQLACKQTKSKFQKRVMDGGTCEGTVSVAWGLETAALCVPLGNYHNQSLDGGERASKVRQGPAPEFIHADDLEGMVKICEGLFKEDLLRNETKDFSVKRKRLLAVHKEYKSFL